ncbi:MAG TPA: hypothetical protein VF903_09335 [Nitrospirota bacterium]
MMRKEAAAVLFVIGVLLFLLASGCARPRSLSELGDDALDSGQGYQSVLFWHVKVLDRTGTIGSRPRFLIYRPSKQGENNFDKPVPEPLAVKGEWTKQDGALVFDAMVFAAARPDTYLFKDVAFFLYTEYVPNYYGGRSQERDVTFTVPFSRVCALDASKLFYLGEVVIEFLKEQKAGYSYHVSLVRDDNDFQDAVKQFRESYPGLFKRFNKTADTPSCKVLFMENFSSNTQGWALSTGDRRASSSFSGGKYLVQSENDGCHWAGITPSFDQPHDFDVELVSEAKSKADALGHGLSLGVDRENIYNFLTTGNGEAKVELYRNGESQPDPVPGKAVASGKPSETMTTRQKIEARGDTLRYFVNDQYVGEIKNELAGNGWFLGLAVCGKQRVEFDQLKLIEQ